MAESRLRQQWDQTLAIVAAFTGKVLDNPFIDRSPPRFTREHAQAWAEHWANRNSGIRKNSAELPNG